MTTEADQAEEIGMEVAALATALRVASEVLESRVEPGKSPHLNLPGLLVPSGRLSRLEEWRRKDVEETSNAINKLSEHQTAIQRTLTNQIDKAKVDLVAQISKLGKAGPEVADIKDRTKEVEDKLSGFKKDLDEQRSRSSTLEVTCAEELAKREDLEEELRALNARVGQLQTRVDKGFEAVSKTIDNLVDQVNTHLKALDGKIADRQAENVHLTVSLEALKTSQPTNDDLTRLRNWRTALTVIAIVQLLLFTGLSAFFLSQRQANADQIQNLTTQLSAITKRLEQ